MDDRNGQGQRVGEAPVSSWISSAVQEEPTMIACG